MKKILSILMCVSLLSFSFYSCSDSDDDDNGGEDNTKVKLSAAFNCVKEGATVNSPYTTMYIFDTKGENTSEWVYNKTRNMVRKDGTVVYAKYTFLSDIEGKINEDIDNNITYLYVVICGIDPTLTHTDKFEAKANISIDKTLTTNN